MTGSCPGRYQVSVYVRRLHGPSYPPFGSAAFTIS